MRFIIIILLSVVLILSAYYYGKHNGQHDVPNDKEIIEEPPIDKIIESQISEEANYVKEKPDLHIENIDVSHNENYVITYTITVKNNSDKVVTAFEVYNDEMIRPDLNSRQMYGDPMRIKAKIYPDRSYTFTVNSTQTKMTFDEMNTHVCSAIFSDGSKVSYH